MTSHTKKFDLCIIGAGPGGYVAAIRAAQLGLKVGIVEANHLGGICLNWGCIPTKALLKSSEVNHLLHNLDSFGFSAEKIKFDFTKIIERSRIVSKRLSTGISGLMKKNKIEVIDGFGKFLDSKKISISKDGKEFTQIEATYFIIATGARARVIPGMEPNAENIWTYREAMTAKALPQSLLVVGSGAIGSEFASFYRNMGSEVTLIEMAENILPVEDEEISKLARKSFEKQGIKIHASALLKSLKKDKDEMVATIEIGGKIEELKAEKVIMAVGIVANVENIGLEKTKVKTDKGRIVANGYLETAEANIFAIGDVVGAPWLAHKASHEGVIAAEKIASKLGKYDAKKIHPIKVENIPGCTYSMPQIASVGLTEKKAIAAGKKIKVGRFPYAANGKAIAAGESEGLIKVIFDEKTGELLGAHLIGAEVTEMIQGYVIAKQAELTEEDLMHTIFAHPTMSEMMHEAALDAYGKVIHF
ncbi:MAG: dihydrolipoyl dehydrogenase [Alphaproteobacteria bacterium RIFCSPLOWO2_01_FULL_40_26]|nr:MAG: dihydrolipoyl dehydrogenase [Alphaproteobacteria bacterium RIFCSPHIGHO2_02_FULL_40_34]OFW86278.1 MAG: dihydrolipoyl dehydrogenase [Alphaproteobacteria bacterium RIFCSPHIGHO2_01_FULL_40_8]OFW95538.1 MAG: dihydrolipoyl dehydrogenase [Alphaproteobacteria bacterium RIFCSPLOWO2_01_FULL_40_26]OFX09622.1 MAG: dihydrolipoyl dehydrogenase [Alphaproteobacteria bacterium RIFCSPLOWO2_02_FULL_40_19]OFX11335.1 MAG: dihydrolipoyl dehydrogenase [Alphaproteobacteria bacterium RIFCSPLOWO2_12_FULL_40_11]